MASDSIPSPGLRTVTVRRRGHALDHDVVVVEEPLEIRLDGKPLVVTMRTPGHDEELAAGFLHAEGLVATGDDVAEVRCVAQGRVDVTRANPPIAEEIATREFRATAACGVCGKESLDDLQRLHEDLPPVRRVACPPELLESLPARLRAAQELFEASGGIHAAGLFSLAGDLLCLREDIGRHNAVDKVIGYYVLRNDVPLRDRILVVSGRAGFELVQKGLKAAIPAMVSVGAASSVAVEMATRAGMTLYSFAGRGRGNLHVAERPRPRP